MSSLEDEFARVRDFNALSYSQRAILQFLLDHWDNPSVTEQQLLAKVRELGSSGNGSSGSLDGSERRIGGGGSDGDTRAQFKHLLIKRLVTLEAELDTLQPSELTGRELYTIDGSVRQVYAAVTVPDAVFLSFNIWFQPIYVDERMREIARLAAESDPLPAALALQEIVPRLTKQLWPALREAGFREPFEQPMETRGFNGEERYGVALSTRPPLGPLIGGRFDPFPHSRMGRGLLLARCDWPGMGTVVLGTAHLESYVGAKEQEVVVPERRDQLKIAAHTLAMEATEHFAPAAVLLGDMNWNDKSDGDPLDVLGSGWSDAFVAAGKPRGMYATLNGGRYRIDRAFVWQNHRTQSLPPWSAAGLGTQVGGYLALLA